MKILILPILYLASLSFSYAEEPKLQGNKNSKENDLKERIDFYITDLKSELPSLVPGEDGVILYDAENRFNVIQFVLVLKDKINEDIDLEELDQVIEISKGVEKVFCNHVTNINFKHQELFSYNNVRNRLLFLDKAGQFVYISNEFGCTK